jgi:hypothetical protein
MSDYFLNKIYDSLISKKPVPKKSEPIVEKKETFKPLSKVYQLIYEQEVPVSSNQQLQVNASPDQLDSLSKLSGITDKQAVEKLFAIYEFLKKNNSFKDVNFRTGSDPKRIYNYTGPTRTYSDIQQIILNPDFKDKKLIITYAGQVRKLRTPLPVDRRVVEWGFLEASQQIEQQYNLILQTNKANPSTPLKRILAIFDLYIQNSNKIELRTKMPPGINAELVQVETFNNVLKDTDPLPLLLPGDTEKIPDVEFNGAAKVKGTPKADIALTNKGVEVFWISFKEDSYSLDPSVEPGFQQWGSLKKSYDTDKGIQEIVNLFLTTAVTQQTENFTEYNVDEQPLELEQALKDRQYDLNLLQDKELKTVKRVYLVQERTSLYLDLFTPNAEQNTDFKELALKGIYGTDFELGKNVPFGKDNVNLILQTPEPIKFEKLVNMHDDPVAWKMMLKPGSHIIKNPQLPEHGQYLPCLSLRYTHAERFRFINQQTKQPELILGGRLLIYPIGKVGKNSKQITI